MLAIFLWHFVDRSFSDCDRPRQSESYISEKESCLVEAPKIVGLSDS